MRWRDCNLISAILGRIWRIGLKIDIHEWVVDTVILFMELVMINVNVDARNDRLWLTGMTYFVGPRDVEDPWV